MRSTVRPRRRSSKWVSSSWIAVSSPAIPTWRREGGDRGGPAVLREQRAGDAAAGKPTRMTAAEALKKAHEALERGDRAEARRSARLAAKFAPGHEAPWLYLAAAAEPRAGLAYLAKALEINPKSKAARKAIRWMVRRLPPPRAAAR